MRRMGPCLVYLSTATLAVLSAQTPAFMTAGYISPTPIWAATGQIITVFISGAKTLLPSIDPEVRAKTLPLPTSLAGFSATVRQGNNTYAAPVISIEQTPSCDSDIDRSSTLFLHSRRSEAHYGVQGERGVSDLYRMAGSIRPQTRDTIRSRHNPSAGTRHSPKDGAGREPA